jgi:hypothetical protein
MTITTGRLRLSVVLLLIGVLGPPVVSVVASVVAEGRPLSGAWEKVALAVTFRDPEAGTEMLSSLTPFLWLALLARQVGIGNERERFVRRVALTVATLLTAFLTWEMLYASWTGGRGAANSAIGFLFLPVYSVVIVGLSYGIGFVVGWLYVNLREWLRAPKASG